MSVDVCPDGSWIVFDLLGHVYRMDAEGGTTEPLTQNSGVALNYHPRISPDGRTVAFISDRGGQDNLWIMNADGSQPRVVFHDLNSRALTPAWTPDGEYIVVRRDGIGRRSSGGAFAPEIYPEGRWLAFGRHIPDGTVSFKGGISSASPQTAATRHPSRGSRCRRVAVPKGSSAGRSSRRPGGPKVASSSRKSSTGAPPSSRCGPTARTRVFT